jgi:hypothetical protein
MMTDEELEALAADWLAPLEAELADLMDKAERMDAQRFAAEVEAAIARVPIIYDRLDPLKLALPLEREIGRAIIKALSDDGQNT